MEWIHDSGRPSVDLVNTMRDRHLGGRELLTGPSALAEWILICELWSQPVRPTAADVDQARSLREAIDRLGRGVRRRTDVGMINATARTAPVRQFRLRGAELVDQLARSASPVQSVLGLVAADAIELIMSGGVLRICASDRCGLRFLDSSPQQNRLWCSMARCGNRAKARQHYARQKAVSADAGRRSTTAW